MENFHGTTVSFNHFNICYVFQNGLIEHNDIESFTEKLRSYSGWSKDSKEYLELVDVNSTFYECLRDQVKAEFQGRFHIIFFRIFYNNIALQWHIFHLNHLSSLF